MLKLVLFLQILFLILFIVTGYYFYMEFKLISSEIDNALELISDFQGLMPKLESAIETINSLEDLFLGLPIISDILNILVDPSQGKP